MLVYFIDIRVKKDILIYIVQYGIVKVVKYYIVKGIHSNLAMTVGYIIVHFLDYISSLFYFFNELAYYVSLNGLHEILLIQILKI